MGDTGAPGFVVWSDGASDGRLAVAQTCDGAASNPAVSWRGAPVTTASYAVVMHHVPPTGEPHWYWIVYDLDASVDHLDEAATPPGVVGTNSVDRHLAYTPPCSQGPGDKTYTITVYALSRRPALPDPARVTRAVLLQALQGAVLAEAHVDLVYARPAAAGATSHPAIPAGGTR